MLSPVPTVEQPQPAGGASRSPTTLVLPPVLPLLSLLPVPASAVGVLGGAELPLLLPPPLLLLPSPPLELELPPDPLPPPLEPELEPLPELDPLLDPELDPLLEPLLLLLLPLVCLSAVPLGVPQPVGPS